MIVSKFSRRSLPKTAHRVVAYVSVYLVFSYSALAQTNLPPGADPAQLEAMQQQVREQLAKEILSIAEKEKREAADYRSIAETIATIGEAQKQQGQTIPAPTVFDGLQAVDLGQKLNPLETDWQSLQERLEALLDASPPQEQQENDQNQDGEGDDQENDKDSSDQGSQDQNGENSDSDQSSENQQDPGENSESETDQGDSSNENTENDPDGENANQQKDPPKAPNNENGSVGDLEDSPEKPELDQKPSQPKPAPMQQVGGVEEQGQQTAQQAMAQQLMDQLKQQDDPGQLFMLMQQAENEKDGVPVEIPKNRKDW